MQRCYTGLLIRRRSSGGLVRLAPLSLLLGYTLFASNTPAQSPSANDNLIDIYKNIHAHPELSHFEEHTSALLASELRKAGYVP